MRRLIILTASLTWLGWSASACSESSFSSSSGTKSNSDKSAVGGPGGTDSPSGGTDAPGGTDARHDDGGGPDGSCVAGDKVNFAWTGDIKQCIIDQGKTFNFDSNKCAEMRQASFDCSWDNLVSAMDAIGLSPTDKIKTDRADGAKLVTCGQSKDGNRIVVQWIREPDGGFKCGDAAKSSGMITTGCYTVYPSGKEPPPAANDDERKKQVYACMNKL